jgi:hypothetical protein
VSGRTKAGNSQAGQHCVNSRGRGQFEQVADSIFQSDILAADECRAIRVEFDSAGSWTDAKIAVSRISDAGVFEIIGIADRKRRDAVHILFCETEMDCKPAASRCLSIVEESVLAFTSAEFGLDFSDCRDAEIVRYSTGGEFKPHTDSHRESAHRALTVIIYLNDDFGGGGTAFPLLDYTCQPRTGRVVVFPTNMLHAGLPVTTGEKEIIVFWVSYPGYAPSSETCG